MSCALLQLWMSDAQGDGEGDGEGEAEETEPEPEPTEPTAENWASEKRKNKNTFFTSHQPKLRVWLCVHIHAQYVCLHSTHNV